MADAAPFVALGGIDGNADIAVLFGAELLFCLPLYVSCLDACIFGQFGRHVRALLGQEPGQLAVGYISDLKFARKRLGPEQFLRRCRQFRLERGQALRQLDLGRPRSGIVAASETSAWRA